MAAAFLFALLRFDTLRVCVVSQLDQLLPLLLLSNYDVTGQKGKREVVGWREGGEGKVNPKSNLGYCHRAELAIGLGVCVCVCVQLLHNEVKAMPQNF